jgi:hypothetical protein
MLTPDLSLCSQPNGGQFLEWERTTRPERYAKCVIPCREYCVSSARRAAARFDTHC